MANGAANYNLEEDIQHFVNEELNDQLAAAGFDSKKCGYKCDFNNGALSSGTLDPSIFKDSNSVDHQYSNSEKKFLCGPGGALEGKTVIVHLSGGTRAACGILTAV